MPEAMGQPGAGWKYKHPRLGHHCRSWNEGSSEMIDWNPESIEQLGGVTTTPLQ